MLYEKRIWKMVDGYSQVHHDGGYPHLIFSEIEQEWIIYVGGIVSISITLGVGLWLVRDKKEKGK